VLGGTIPRDRADRSAGSDCAQVRGTPKALARGRRFAAWGRPITTALRSEGYSTAGRQRSSAGFSPAPANEDGDGLMGDLGAGTAVIRAAKPGRHRRPWLHGMLASAKP